MPDHEADVVIVGYGGAGASAAIVAADAGAQVLILEKNPEGGGNTRYSGGNIRTYLDLDKAADYFETLCEGTTDRSVIDAFVRESSLNPDWIRELGGEIVARPPGGGSGFRIKQYLAAFPNIRGAEGIGHRVRVKGGGEFAGIDLWKVLTRKVAEKKVGILCSTPVKRLLMTRDEGVTGVTAVSGGKDITVRARRSVILACGGFEYDPAMHLNYFGQRYYGLGNPGNTGDGLRLAADVGADFWHMNAAAATFGYKFPEYECGMMHLMPSAGFIYVDQLGRRFMDEPGTDPHFTWATTAAIDTKTLQRTRIPAYVIFDEDTRTRGPIAALGHGKASDVYQWSRDNKAEIDKGWIRCGQTVADLAAQINIGARQLQMTVAHYNLLCVGGYDPDFGRAPHALVPLGRPPYYAAELWPCLFNTQGGPKRNARAQVMDVWGDPIRRLYSAGELGSIWHRNYPGAGNVSEFMAFGRIAGRNAAAERPLAA